MPDPQQVQVKMPDGKMWTIPATNLDKAKARGAVLVQPPSGFDRIKKGFNEYVVDPVKSTLAEAQSRGVTRGGGYGNTAMEIPGTIIDSLLDAQGNQLKQFAATEKENEKNPTGLGTARSAAEGTLAALPGVGPLIRDFVTTKDPYEMTGKAAGIITGEKVPGMVRGAPEALEAAKDSLQNGGVAATREILGVPERTIQRAEEEHNAQLAEIEKKYEEKVQAVGSKTAADEASYKMEVEHAKDEYAKKVAQHNQDMIDQSKRQSAATVKQDTFSPKVRSGPAYKRLTQMADSIGDSVTKLDKTVRAAYDARWNAWRQAMGDAEGNFTPVQNAVMNAEDNILKGSPEKIAIFNNILKEGEDPLLSQASVFRGGSRGTDLKEVLSSMKSEGERTRFLNSLKDEGVSLEGPRGAKDGATLPIEQIQGYSTELGNKIYRSATIPGDVRRALKSVKDAADAEVERVSGSKGQLSTYRQLKKDWAQYMEDFYDHDGPLYKMKNAINSDRRLSLISGGEGKRVIDSLGNYSRFDPNIQAVGRVRSLISQLDSLPSSGGTVPKEVARPRFPQRPAARPLPDRPDMPQFNLPKFVEDRVTKRAEQIGTTGHALMAYWILKDVFSGKMPSPGLLATPVVQHYIMRYLTSPRFMTRIQGMVQR